jgi:hypothetical protein
MHEVLYHNDQLRWSMENKAVLNNFVEPPLNFKPTYKFNIRSDLYDTGKKQRIPAWADRILYVPKPLRVINDNAIISTNSEAKEFSNNSVTIPVGIQCITYNADFALRTSDHRPVYASFVIDIDYGSSCNEKHQVYDTLLSQLLQDSVESNFVVKGLVSNDINNNGNVTKHTMNYNEVIEFSSHSQVCVVS